MVSLRLLQPSTSTLSSTPTLLFLQDARIVPTPTTSLSPPSSHFCKKHLTLKSITLPFALAESGGSNKSLNEPDPDPSAKTLLQELADSFVLPADYFGQLPQDLRLDLNDAAFDLSNGPVVDECGKELGDTLVNISQAWEQADTSTSTTLTGKLPFLVSSLTDSAKAAFGKRLVTAGRRFQSMGNYGQGELQRIAKTMTTSGKLLAASRGSTETREEPKEEARMLKFGDLQVELTPGKAYVGSAIGVVFGILSWEVSQGIQTIPESSFQYANENALLLAKSLRVALLAIFYSSTVLSAFVTVGLIVLAGQLKSSEK